MNAVGSFATTMHARNVHAFLTLACILVLGQACMTLIGSTDLIRAVVELGVFMNRQ